MDGNSHSLYINEQKKPFFLKYNNATFYNYVTL
jgi:hypothetical protein